MNTLGKETEHLRKIVKTPRVVKQEILHSKDGINFTARKQLEFFQE